MSDSPLPPQTDYPYAARVHVGTAPDELPPPSSAFARITARLDILLDWQPADNRNFSPDQGIVSAPAVVVAICAFALINALPLVVMQILKRPPAPWLAILIFAPLGGVIAAEFIAFAFALVWSRGHFVWRLAVHWFLALTLYSCWVPVFLAVSSLQYWGNESLVTRAVLAGLPAICLAVQAPLWCLRIYGGWRLINEAEAGPAQPTQVSIGDILFGTAIVAASLAAWRVMFDDPSKFGEGFWIGWAIAFPVFALISILTAAPLLRLVFGSNSPVVAASSVFGYWLLLSVLSAVLFYYIFAGPWRELTLCFSLVTLTGFITVAIPLWLARRAGYRLRIGN